MLIILAIFAVLGIVGGGLGFIGASTVFQEIVSGMVAMIGFICLAGASILDVFIRFRNQTDGVTEKLLEELKELRQEQEQTNRLLDWIGQLQQQAHFPGQKEITISDEETEG